MEKCLQNLGKIAATFSQKKPGDVSLKEAHSKAISQWEGTMNRVARLKTQLDQVPAQWILYRQRFEEMVQWMDKVDQNIKSLLRQVDTIEEFEKERSTFQVR